MHTPVHCLFGHQGLQQPAGKGPGMGAGRGSRWLCSAGNTRTPATVNSAPCLPVPVKSVRGLIEADSGDDVISSACRVSLERFQ